MGIVSAQPDPERTQGADALAPLLAPIAALKGVKENEARLIAKAAGGPRVLDLLLHLPERYLLRRRIERPSQAMPDGEVLVQAVIGSHKAGRSAQGRPYVRVRCEAGGERLTAFLMNWQKPWAEKALPVGSARWLAGTLKEEEDGDWVIVNPQVAAREETIPRVQPVWPLTGALTLPQVTRAMGAALPLLPDFAEWQDAPLLRREGWPGFAAALRALQAPDAEPGEPPRKRLAYDELLSGQVALGLVRRRSRERPGRALSGDGALRAKALAAFGFPPTEAQRQAIGEIDADLAAPRRMLRLLQGDVGAGKTLVALMAMLRAAEAGAQAALMAPTELLARQHLRTFERLCGAAGVPVALLTGSVKGKERKRVLAGLADGSIPLVLGTHALFQEGVLFRDLGLAVVDEQHRFGVAQRLMLAEKGEAVDLLVMTATPIPRTLLLTQWGEMAVSRLAGKPPGRQPITTRIVSQDRLADIVARLGEALAREDRAYWVVRAISGSERDDSVAAEDRFAELSARFPGVVGLAHGMQDIEVREAALADFAAGRTRLLVATTVIEVGVDVPEATIMLIEQAERFGLAALHQLRGRVGRGTRPSSCLLVHSPGLTEGEKRRLLVLRDSEDGFVIAEEDLRQRGGGDALGARQAGLPGARLLDPREDPEEYARLVDIAHRDAELLLQKDPALAGPRGRAARQLLALFGHDMSMAPLDAG
ncbi:ATP-dependent DNA helicase RecG [Roseomonas sp. PWR1]|uniref:ATP-dependent DNA helicase RecG n=1 Tax=Roseomonas nitratireducens TaxID=2820810 RepID=A0ABS4ANB6_9PROT|nr:ATP-dependent DNA helicase RecG [Neoroseomonas nitratireducens]MBP0462860.1 ATP-dependent DNA helicase RecG [Neoroseomonas nitratireducens]